LQSCCTKLLIGFTKSTWVEKLERELWMLKSDFIADDRIGTLCSEFAACPDLTERLTTLLSVAHGRVTLTSNFGVEDQILTHAAVVATAATGRKVNFVTLDTGRLFPETYDVWAATERRYGIRVSCAVPEADALMRLVDAQGIDGFRMSVGARRACCEVRKVAPLRRTLLGGDIWVTGLRADQSVNRAGTPFAEWDNAFGILKVNPLADWTRERASSYAKEHDVPLNKLHASGFLSIGCAPCTRAISSGEPERAGRWWWEDEDRKECGLHQNAPDPKVLPEALQ
jgi:phosphoadenosine phosphosulfate reductase